jgi:uncharacterized membrane protein YfcA
MSVPSPQARSAREAFGRPFGGLMGSTNPSGLSRGPRRRLPLKLIIGVVSAFLLVSTALDIVPAVRAGLHDGTRGTWVATSRTCHGSACVWTGKFLAAGGHVVVTSAHYAGPIPAGTRTGTSVPALFTGSSGLVFPTAGSDLWIELVIALLASVLGLYWASRQWWARYLRKLRKVGRVTPP